MNKIYFIHIQILIENGSLSYGIYVKIVLSLSRVQEDQSNRHQPTVAAVS